MFGIKGKGLVYIEGKNWNVKRSFFEITKGQKHSIENTGKLNLEFIEIQFEKKVVEEDIVRLKDIWKSLKLIQIIVIQPYLILVFGEVSRC